MLLTTIVSVILLLLAQNAHSVRRIKELRNSEDKADTAKQHQNVVNFVSQLFTSKNITPDDFVMVPNSEPLGEGGFGIVNKVQLKNDKSSHPKLFAMKTMKSANNELKVLAQIKEITPTCPFIVNVKCVDEQQNFEQRSTKHRAVLEYINGQDMNEILSIRGGFSEDLTRIFLFQVATALEWLHINKILYGDLKPEISCWKQKTMDILA
uniref:Protein kinase domain-containing protein n=1 Tax=Ditylenchus dipsaci TaxID=166011 RepID=A0A915ER30_9BILA